MIKQNIVRAIKEARWVAIEYLNKNDDKKYFWIAIKDIDIKKKMFCVDAFNVGYLSKDESGVIEANNIAFNNIKSAKIISNTSYEQPEELIGKINANIDELNWLGYDSYSDAKLDYIEECMIHEEVAYQTETTLVSGIDHELLESIPYKQEFKLSLVQLGELISNLETLSKQYEDNRREIVTLVLNYLSIRTKNGLFVVAYKELTFNPATQSLILGSEILFNYDFANEEIKDFKHNLHNYLDVETDEFTQLYIQDQTEATKILEEAVNDRGETLDETPRIFELRRSFTNHITRELNQIKQQKSFNTLSDPLVAFFGNKTTEKKRRKHVDVVALDDKVNIDQLRAIYNSLVQPITYVQGPPGTGKTATIINILISSFFNNQKVLVTSNNNKPINDINNKLRSLKDSAKRDIHLPFLRIGNNNENIKTLNWLKELLPRIRNLKPDDSKLQRHVSNKREKSKEINYYLSTYEKRIELEEQIDILETAGKMLNDTFKFNIISHVELERSKKELSKLPEITDDMIRPHLIKHDYHFLTWLFFYSIKHFNTLFMPRYSDLLEIINDGDDEARVKAFNTYLANEENFKKLQAVFPVILTTNQSAHKLGPQGQHFDLTIIDEAGQCSIGPSLFAIARAERLLLVGDQHQLKPVISILPETNKALMRKHEISESYNYVENSILSTMQKVDRISKVVMLTYHYRSRPPIINFSNQKYYDNLLKLQKEEAGLPPALVLIGAESNHRAKQNQRNVAPTEVSAIIHDLNKMKYKNVGIITPFRNQAELIKVVLDKAGITNVDVGTIHTFQGDEKDVIYFTPAITPQTRERTFTWVKDNKELINVASTRAKNRLIVVADEKEIKQRSHFDNALNDLIKYVKNNGINVEIQAAAEDLYANGANYRNYSSEAEKAFFETINHIMSTIDNYVVRTEVSVASIFDQFTSPKKYDYGLKSKFDFVVFRKVGSLEMPILVIELDGEEHTNNKNVERRDKLKEAICRDNNIKLHRIKNNYARRYIFLKPLILNLLK